MIAETMGFVQDFEHTKIAAVGFISAFAVLPVFMELLWKS